METAQILEVIEEDDSPIMDLSELLAVFDDMDARANMTDMEHLRALGAPAHLSFDLSDAAHYCASNDDGICTDCANGGTPMLANNHSKYL